MNSNQNVAKHRFGFHPSRKSVAVVALLIALLVGLVFASAAPKENGATGPVAAETQVQNTTKPRSGHSEYLVGLTRRALSDGFGKSDVTVLEPVTGPGRDAVANQLLALASKDGGPLGKRITARGLKAAPVDDHNTTFVGPFSTLNVSDDGTKFRFRGNIDDPDEISRARSSGKKIDKEELEKIGRRFVADALGDFVKLDSDESIVFLGAKYFHRESMSAKTDKHSDEIVASIAVFGREVQGVPVIGSGSKITVWFANDRQPVAFDVDWPVYKATGMRQAVLSRERLFERVTATTISPAGSDRANVSRFECGYIDLGASKRGSGIQAGCAIHYEGSGDNAGWARVEFVPAGEKVLPDPKWPLARLLSEGKMMNTDTREFTAYVTTSKIPLARPRLTERAVRP